ncbi:hypothetical protein HHK36_026776 [Tetracentron sinense]|uniref:Protein TIFY n=1 Tax=Tetracentron sinense TaxID=13715 RepID=A0A834YK99_TETSI|nr:hypothetical protein HHK36_026776 [Tetracentron sinense]
MPETDAMNPGNSIFRSPLDKPLELLTEEDISQLTREDCRKFLKDKGMRRPSWNKSQAIQQVISLKNLLETKIGSVAGTGAGDGTGIRHEISVSRPENPPEASTNINFLFFHEKLTAFIFIFFCFITKLRSVDFQISVPADESVPWRRKDPQKPDFSGGLPGPLAATDNKSTSPRFCIFYLLLLLHSLFFELTAGVTNGLVGQMTIFYCGKVNVYDGIPADKARAILQLAASPVHWPLDAPSSRASALQPLPCHSHATSVRLDPAPAAISPTLQTAKLTENSQQYREEGKMFREIEPEVEGITSRKASVRRYLEKRKDRGRFKSNKKIGGSSSSRLQMYLNHQVGSQVPNEQPSRSSTSSPPQPRPPHTPTRCSSVENQVKNVDLSDKGKLQSPLSFTCLLI